MSPAQAPKIILCTALCVAAGWGGRAMAVRLRGGSPPAGRDAAPVESTKHAVAKIFPAGTTAAERMEQEEMQRAVAHCTTAALWELVRTKEPHDPDDEDEAIARELLDREGPEAVLHAEELEDPARRGEWTHRLLALLAEKDQAKALELFLALPENCGTDIQRKMTRNDLIRMAGPVSADRLLATVDALSDRGMLNLDPSSRYWVDFAEGFDFRKTLDHLAGMDEGAGVVKNYDLLSAWASVAPLAALDWIQDHPDWKSAATFDRDPLESALQAIATSSSPEREEALLRVPQYYEDPEKRNDFWEGLAGNNNGYVDPELAKIAGKMDLSLGYLVRSMEEGRHAEEKDPAWAQVPADLRDAAAEKFLADWAEKDPSPKAGKEREHWRVTFDKAIGK